MCKGYGEMFERDVERTNFIRVLLIVVNVQEHTRRVSSQIFFKHLSFGVKGREEIKKTN